MRIVPINTERFLLRKIEREDLDDIFRLLSNPEIIENLNIEIHKCKENSEKLIAEYLEGYEKGTKYPYAIIEKSTNKFVGVFLIKLDLFDEECFEFTVYLNKKYWGKGIYTEILPYMTKVAFEDIKTENFRGFVMERNIASSKVLERCNFKLEKIFEVTGIEGKIKSYLITRKNYIKE